MFKGIKTKWEKNKERYKLYRECLDANVVKKYSFWLPGWIYFTISRARHSFAILYHKIKGDYDDTIEY